MKLVVCGCSYSALSNLPEYKGTHWSEILADKINAKLINLAVSGCSNNYIRLQVDAAIKLKPDFIIINATTSDRLEVKLNNLKNIFSQNNKKYLYTDFINNSCHVKLKNNYKKQKQIISLPIYSVIKNTNNILNEKQTKSVEDYIVNVYDEIWKKQLDEYVLKSILYELVYEKKHFVFNHSIFDKNFEISTEIKNKHFLIGDLDFRKINEKFSFEEKDDPGYHINYNGQNYIAEIYFDFIKNYEFT